MDDIVIKKINETFVVAYKAPHDDECEGVRDRTIIGQGKDSMEALVCALRQLITHDLDLLNKIDSIAEVCGHQYCEVDSARMYLSGTICGLEYGDEGKFDALCYDSETEEWAPFFR